MQCVAGTKIIRLKGPFEKEKEKNLFHIQVENKKKMVPIPQKVAFISCQSVQKRSYSTVCALKHQLVKVTAEL